MALGLALRELQNIHPCTYVQGVLWYGVKLLVEKGSLPSALQSLQLLGNELPSRWFPDQGFRNSVSELDFPRYLIRRELIFKKFMEFIRREPDTAAELDIRLDDLTPVLVRDTADCYLVDRGVEVDGFFHYTGVDVEPAVDDEVLNAVDDKDGEMGSESIFIFSRTKMAWFLFVQEKRTFYFLRCSSTFLHRPADLR